MFIENQKSVIGSKTENQFYFFGNWFSNIFLSFSSKKLHKNYQMTDKISSLICVMLSVYEGLRQAVKCGQQRSHILQDSTGIEI